MKTSTIRIDIYIMHLVLLPNTLIPLLKQIYDLKREYF